MTGISYSMIMVAVVLITYLFVRHKGEKKKQENFLKMLIPFSIIILLYLPTQLTESEEPAYLLFVSLLALLFIGFVHFEKKTLYRYCYIGTRWADCVFYFTDLNPS
jgi:Na+/pantothenate symporter